MKRYWPAQPDPLHARHLIRCERPFRYLVEDEEADLGPFADPARRWAQRTLACPVCLAEDGLHLSLIESEDTDVVVRCPGRHEWPDPRLDRRHFVAHSRNLFLEPDSDWVWLEEAGYGQEPPPPVDYWAEGREAAVVITKYFAKRATGRLGRTLRRGRRKAGRAVTGAARAAGQAVRGRLAGQDPPCEEQAQTAPAPAGRRRPKGPAAYRRAPGVPAPSRGPRCLVCSDTGRITAPGVDIPCPECPSRRTARTRTRDDRTE
ncbi:hypothetical protein AB0O31_32935 [Kitasatospora cineracea]|uniref:hypothetical protein n=1 Tax=Kitasatospora cineracea TaxID=88074 RepID=UPI00343C01E6